MARQKHGNLAGKTFGRWTVLEKRGIGTSGRRWFCRCTCGTEREVNGCSLINKGSLSCGCLQREVATNRPYEDLTGKTFNRWTVIEPGPRGNKGSRRYYCKCECGTIKLLKGYAVKNGETLSCGCLNREHVSQAMKKDLTGQVFTRWTVLREYGKSKVGAILWWCRCECGTERFVTSQSLLSKRSKSCGCYKLERITKHGLSDTIEYKVMQSRKHREHRKQIDTSWTIEMDEALRKFQPACVICGMTLEEHQAKHGRALHVDHVIPITNRDGTDGSPLIPGNAVMLCMSHNCSKCNYPLSSLPIEWQANIIWNAIQFKNHWEELQERGT